MLFLLTDRTFTSAVKRSLSALPDRHIERQLEDGVADRDAQRQLVGVRIEEIENTCARLERLEGNRVHAWNAEIAGSDQIGFDYSLFLRFEMLRRALQG